MMAVMAACAAIGVGLGALVDAEAVGGFLGGLVGVAAALVAVHRVYMKPLQREWDQKDYSHLRPQFDDEDD